MNYTQSMKKAGFKSYDDWETARYNAGRECNEMPINTPEERSAMNIAFSRFSKLARMGDNN